MRRFQFRLETLLKVRKLAEEQAQLLLAEALERYNQEKEILTQLESDLETNMGLIRVKQQQHLTIGELKIFYNYNDNIKKRIISQAVRVNAAQQQWQEAVHSLEDAIKKRKIVDKLREKCLQDYQTEVLREEQKILDELASQVHRRACVENTQP